MIDMKIKYLDNKIIVYLPGNRLTINNIEELNKEIKNIIIKLIKRYNIDFYGYSKVTIYNNEYYGNILEIEKIYQTYQKNIDLKIIIYRFITMYLEFDDYLFLDRPKDLIIKDGKYYIKIDKNLNLLKYIEYGKVIYD